MSKPRLYLDFGGGYEQDKANTYGKIIKRLEQVYNDVKCYIIVQTINECDEIIAIGFGNLKEIEELKIKILN